MSTPPLILALSIATVLALPLRAETPAQRLSRPATESVAPASLPEVVVTAETESGYTAPETSTLKTKTPAFESPFSIQSVPRQMVEDQKPQRLEDVLRNVSAVSKSGSDYNGLYDVFTIRGFALGNYGQIYRDGFRQRVPQVNLDNIETVEVLKGASGGLYGRIEPGGLINLVTKKPLTEHRFSLEQQLGSDDFTHTIADATGPLTADKSLRYRLIFGYEQGDSFRQFGEYSRLIFAPSIAWDITPDTQLLLSFEYKNNVDSLDGGQVADGTQPASIPGDRYIGVLGTPKSPSEHWLADVSLTHQFNDNWKVKVRGVWWRWDADYSETGPFDGAYPDGTVDLYHFASTERDETWFVELAVDGKFHTGPLKHEVLLGAEYYNFESRTANYFTGAPDIPLAPFDLYHPRYQHYSELPAPKAQYTQNPQDEWYGFTVQDTITVFEKLKVLLSLRYDRTDASTNNDFDLTDDLPAEHVAQDEEFFTPRIGVNYEVTPWLSIFGSYAESFSDSTFGTLADGQPTEPESATQYELGLKGRWLDGKLNATLAAFHLTKENLTTDLPNSAFVAQSGEARSRGIELDLAGQLTRNLSVIASYAYLDTEITHDRDALGGPGNTSHRLPNAPEHSGSLWVKWDCLNGFALAAGGMAIGEREGDLANSFQLDSYVRADAMVSYKFKVGPTQMTAQLNVTNLFDKEYYDGSGGSGRTYVYAAEPRTIIGSVRFEF